MKGGSAPVSDTPEPATNTANPQLENIDGEDEEDPEAKRRRILEETRDIDADSDEAEDDSSEDDRSGFTAGSIWTGADGLLVTTTKTKQPNSSVN